jgi:RNA-directed DNA polymerase
MTMKDAAGEIEMSRARSEGSGRKPREQGLGASSVTAKPRPRPEVEAGLLEMILSRENMMEALRRMESNKGAPGVDGLTVGQLRAYLTAHWAVIKEDLLAGRYEPAPVRGVEIPKPGGGMRQLGIPTVMDRLIQQAMHQVLMPLFDPGFSNWSYGFRPGRSAH